MEQRNIILWSDQDILFVLMSVDLHVITSETAKLEKQQWNDVEWIADFDMKKHAGYK